MASDMHFTFSFIFSLSFPFCSSVSCDLLFTACVFLYTLPLVSSLSLPVRMTPNANLRRLPVSLELSYSFYVLFQRTGADISFTCLMYCFAAFEVLRCFQIFKVAK